MPVVPPFGGARPASPLNNSHGREGGSHQKQIVLDVIDTVARPGETIDNKLAAMVATLIDSMVVTLNKSGVFGKTA